MLLTANEVEVKIEMIQSSDEKLINSVAMNVGSLDREAASKFFESEVAIVRERASDSRT